MFGIFSRKRKVNNETTNKNDNNIIDICSSILRINYELIKNNNRKRATDDFSIGYVWGFVEYFLQENGYVADERSASIITSVYINVFENKDVENIIKRAFDIRGFRGDAKMTQGMIAGRNDVIAWIKNRRDPTISWLLYTRDEL